MSVVESVKDFLGMSTPEQHTYHCHECDTTFETSEPPDSYWLACLECGGEDVTHQPDTE